MSGFAAARLGMPEAGLIYGELVDRGQNICRAVAIPMMAMATPGSAAHRHQADGRGYARG